MAWWAIRIQPSNPVLAGALIVNTGLHVYILKKVKREKDARDRRIEEMMRTGGRRGIVLRPQLEDKKKE